MEGRSEEETMLDSYMYRQYIRDAETAELLNRTILDIAWEEGWFSSSPFRMPSASRLHSYALMKGLITEEEYKLLLKFY